MDAKRGLLLAAGDYLPVDGAAAPADPSASFAWRILHAFAFLEGGLTFIAGTAVLYWPASPPLATLSAALYTVGSLGFLFVDVQEFFTFVSEPVLRANIALSATGSLLYVLGSLGFLPAFEAATPIVGTWGFLLGSALIFVSQSMKLLRIGGAAGCGSDNGSSGSGSGDGCGGRGCGCGGFSVRALCGTKESATAAVVEGGAGLGALLFLVGTAVFAAPLGESAFGGALVLALWLAGSLAFTAGGLSLAFRHFVMGVA